MPRAWRYLFSDQPQKVNRHIVSLVDVARAMLNLDLPHKTLPELETNSEIANTSLEATLDKESTRPAERVKNHMM
jgi:hypothetical protein